MGFGPFSSESTSSATTNNADNRAGAAGASQLNYEQFGPSSLSARGQQALTNSSGNHITTNSLDAPLIQRALDVLDHVVNGQTSLSLAGANNSSTALAAANAAAAAAAQQTGDLAKTKLTDGANIHQRTILIGAAILAALIGIFYLSRRS